MSTPMATTTTTPSSSSTQNQTNALSTTIPIPITSTTAIMTPTLTTPPPQTTTQTPSTQTPPTQTKQSHKRATRKPGRPATYVFDKPDDQLSDKERKLKISIEKRRLRQNRSYHRRKGKKSATSNPNNTNNNTIHNALSKSLKNLNSPDHFNQNNQTLNTNDITSSVTNALPPSTLHHVLTNTLQNNTPHPWQIAFNSSTSSLNNEKNLKSQLTSNNNNNNNNNNNSSNLNNSNSTTNNTNNTNNNSNNNVSVIDIANNPLSAQQLNASTMAAVSSLDIGNTNTNTNANHNLTPKFIAGFAQNPLDLLASATADRSNPNNLSTNNNSLSMSQSSQLQQTPSLSMDPSMQSDIVSIPAASLVPPLTQTSLNPLTNNNNSNSSTAAVAAAAVAAAVAISNHNHGAISSTVDTSNHTSVNNNNSNNNSTSNHGSSVNVKSNVNTNNSTDLLRNNTSVEDTLEIDATVPSNNGPNPQLDEISSFSLGLDVHKAVTVANQQQQDEIIQSGHSTSDSLLVSNSNEQRNNNHNVSNTTDNNIEEIKNNNAHIDSMEVDGDEIENDDPTDALVESAMVAAKEYAKDSINLKDVMDREQDLQRMTGIKKIVFDNLRSKYMGMSNNMQEALRYFIIFPRTFDLNAAAAVAGLDEQHLVHMQGMLDGMIYTNFITTNNGRYELNDAARLFLNEDTTVVNDHIINSTYHVAQKRFIEHYQNQLSKLQDDNIHKIGWLREQAMALYDCERENMEFSEYLLNGRTNDLRQFLSAGITVMRYCVSANNRERVLRRALSEDETSTEDIFLNFNNDLEEQKDVKEKTEESERKDRAHRARLHLALSEAYFDQLKLSDAEEPLLQALKLMGHIDTKSRLAAAAASSTSPSSSLSTSKSPLQTSTSTTSHHNPFASSMSTTSATVSSSSNTANNNTNNNGGSNSSNVVDAVLVLLLLSNLRMGARRVKDARTLCVKALRILAEAGLGRSTFGINAMSNLVSIYLVEGHLEKAKSVASKLLDTLNTMRYTDMPIYADVLGVCAMVSMAEGNHREAERQYDRALETVGKWGSKAWTGIPVQHCLDLDLWLMEGLAESKRKQGKIELAMELEKRAAEDRKNRGLPQHQPALISIGSGGNSSHNNNNNNNDIDVNMSDMNNTNKNSNNMNKNNDNKNSNNNSSRSGEICISPASLRHLY